MEENSYAQWMARCNYLASFILGIGMEVYARAVKESDGLGLFWGIYMYSGKSLWRNVSWAVVQLCDFGLVLQVWF